MISLFVFGVVAADNTTDSTITNVSVVSVNGTALPYYPEVMHIENGQCIPLNSTVDISSLGWGVPHLAYYGRWYDSYSGYNTTPKWQIDMPNTVSALSKFYIDPFIFGNATGYWYQKYDDIYEPAGNLRMFYVNLTCPAPKPLKNITVNVTVVNKTIPDTLPYLPEKKDTDILIARGDSVAISATTPLNWWLFGYTPANHVYDRPASQNTLTLNASDFNGLAVGNYQLLEVHQGDNGVLEEYYNPAYKPYRFANYTYPVIESPFRATTPINIEDLDPQGVEQQLRSAVQHSIDDTITAFSLSYQEPEIQIMRIDAIKNPNNDTWYNIRGYTNLQNGTALRINIDGNLTREREWNTTAIGSSDAGIWRQFNALIPADYKQIFPGQHWVTVTADGKTSTTVGVYIYKELPPHYVPPEYIEYVGVSPFITPQVITKTVTVEVPKNIVIKETVTPSESDWDNYVAAQHRVIIGEAVIAIALIAAVLVLIYIGYVVIRSRRKD